MCLLGSIALKWCRISYVNRKASFANRGDLLVEGWRRVAGVGGMGEAAGPLVHGCRN